MLKKIVGKLPFKRKKDGRGTIINIVQGFSNTIKNLESAVNLNDTKKAEHTQEIQKRNVEIEDLKKHNEIADKLKKNLTGLIS